VLQLIQDQNGFQWLEVGVCTRGNSNYIAWKDRMEEILEDNGLKDFIDRDVPKPVATNTANLDAWQKKVERRGGFYWREYETTLSQVSMGKPHHMQCGRF
jgi:hypothetical protein